MTIPKHIFDILIFIYFSSKSSYLLDICQSQLRLEQANGLDFILNFMRVKLLQKEV